MRWRVDKHGNGTQRIVLANGSRSGRLLRNSKVTRVCVCCTSHNGEMRGTNAQFCLTRVIAPINRPLASRYPPETVRISPRYRFGTTPEDIAYAYIWFGFGNTRVSLILYIRKLFV